MVISKIDLHVRTEYSLSRVGSKDLEVAFVVAWLIASRYLYRLARLPYGKRAFQILELLCYVRQQVGVTNRLMWVWSIMLSLRFKRMVSCCFRDRRMRLITRIYSIL